MYIRTYLILMSLPTLIRARAFPKILDDFSLAIVNKLLNSLEMDKHFLLRRNQTPVWMIEHDGGCGWWVWLVGVEGGCGWWVWMVGVDGGCG